MEIVASIAAKIAESAIKPVGEWLCYSCQYGSNMENLKYQLENLREDKATLEHSIDAHARNGEVIEDHVNTWLTKVGEITELATRIMREGEEEVEARSSNASCLNLKQRHQLSQEAKNIAGNIVDLREKLDLNKVFYRPALEATVRNTDYVTLESRMSVVKGIMKALGDANTNKIGVWGMAGVGKTTLMSEMARKVKGDKLFHEVAIPTVSDNPDVRRIQGEIADTLGLKFEQETVKGRAIQLQRRLSTDKEKKILIILDDLWKQLDLVEIGITPSERCKIVLTSRNQDVLRIMGTQKDFSLQTLTKEEAWKLFEEIAGESFEDPNVRGIATEVAEECAGLPFALVTVSKAFKKKSLPEWKTGLRQLRRLAPRHVPEWLKTVYAPIELIYEKLESDELKFVLWLCAQQHAAICYTDLLKYYYGYRLFHDGIETLEDARNELDTLLGKLKSSCLLLKPKPSTRFRMHDLVRDVTTIIASKDHNMFVMRDDSWQKAWPDVDSFKRCEAFSILGVDIDQLPNEMECPKLRFFLVRSKDSSLQIPDSLFKGMDNLNVLDLTKMQLSSLPSSLLLLRNLQTLCLDQCVLGDISGIGELKNLVILSLLHSDISKLPREVGLLVCLRLLDLSNCSKLKMIPPNVLSSLGKLEELYMGNSFGQWESEGINNERKNASLAELNDLPHLTTLEIQIPDANNAPAYLSLEKLERFIIFIGDIGDWQHDSDHTSRTLKVKFNPSFQPQIWVKLLWKRAEELHLDELHGVDSIIPEIDSEGFEQLKNLRIQNSAQLKYILNLRASVIAFPNLETFVLENMISLEEICHSKLPLTPFKKLRVLEVISCEKLRYVFSSSIVRGLPSLEELKVRNCKNMFAIVVKEEGHGLAHGDVISFPRLQTLVLEKIPKLVSFLSTKTSFTRDGGEIISEGNHDPDMPLLHDQVALPNLKELHLEDLPKINHIWSTKDSQIPFLFQNLQDIMVSRCESLKSIFPVSIVCCLEQLQKISIVDCGMEEIVAAESRGEATVATSLVFPRVTFLFLKGLRRLKRFYKGMHISKWPMLEWLWIDGCENVEILVSGLQSFQETVKERRPDHISSIKQPLFLVDELSFPSLEKLYIYRMEKLEIIWQDQVATTSMQSLAYLKVFSCNSLETIFGKLESPKGNETPQALIAPESRTKERVAKNYICMPLRKTLLCGEGILCQESTTKEDGATRHSTVASPSLQKQEVLPKQIPSRNEDPNTIFRFQNLQEIGVIGCENLRSIFPSSVISCLKQLKILWIQNCGVEEIVSSVEGQGGEAIARFVFPQVTDLRLQELHRLKWFYKGVHVSKWPKLKKMRIEKCHEVEILFASAVVRFQEAVEERRSEMSIKQPLFLVDNDELSFPSLERLQIRSMKKLEIIWQDQVAISSFPNIQTMKICSCEKLETIFGKLEGPNGSETPLALIAPESRTKETVVIEDGGTRHLVSTDASSSLQKQEDLPKKIHCRSEDPNTIFRFQNLQDIEVSGCESLRSVFPSSVISCLMQLKRLRIQNCGVEEIVSVEGEGKEAVVRFVFPQLTNLSLKRLDRLKWFYKGVHVSKWPKLKEMWIEKCDEVEILFASGVVRFQEAVEERRSEMSIKQPLFFVDNDEHSFPSLEILGIWSMKKLEIIWQDQVATSSFSNIQTLKISRCEKLETIFGKLEGPNGNETPLALIALESRTKERVVIEDGGTRHLVSTVACPNFEKGESKDPKTIFRFQNLQEIGVIGCESLGSIFPSSVISCLKQLKRIRIENCGVEEIVSVEGEGKEAVVRFVFPQVTELSLERLDRLKWFYKGVHVSKWPKLEEMNITKCDKVEIFASGVVSFQKAVEERRSEMSIKQPLFLVDNDELSFPSLKILHIWKMDKLEVIRQDSVAEMSLISNLQRLAIYDCEQLRLPIFQSNIFTATCRQLGHSIFR